MPVATILGILLQILNELPEEIPEAEALVNDIAHGEGGLAKLEKIAAAAGKVAATASGVAIALKI